jgi:hypothetical protein
MKDSEYEEPRFGRIGVPTPSAAGPREPGTPPSPFASGPRDPGTIPWLPSDPPRPSLEDCDPSEQLDGAPGDDLGPGMEPDGPHGEGSIP